MFLYDALLSLLLLVVVDPIYAVFVQIFWVQ
jgi:hypothetical protein